MYKVVLSKQAVKDLEKIKRTGLSKKAKVLTALMETDPFQTPPPYEKLVGDLRGYYSRRINDQHRYTYQVLPNTESIRDATGELYRGIVKILRMWTHYE